MKPHELKIGADVLMARVAELAVAAAVIEGNHDTVALFEMTDFFADLFNDSTKLMTYNAGQLGFESDPFPIAHPSVPIAAANSIGFDPHHGVAKPSLRIRDLANHERLLKLF
jgi:hypothetical protein